MPLTRLIYCSQCTDCSEGALDDILRVAQARNGEDGITGALIVGDGRFLQILEGRRAPLNRCLGRIARDPRHRDLQVVAAGETRHRLFPSWGMRAIDTSVALRFMVTRHAANRRFQPEQMSQLLIEDLFRRLAVELCELPAPWTEPQPRAPGTVSG